MKKKDADNRNKIKQHVNQIINIFINIFSYNIILNTLFNNCAVKIFIQPVTFYLLMMNQKLYFFSTLAI